jgi:hypothetical protein
MAFAKDQLVLAKTLTGQGKMGATATAGFEPWA